MTEFFRGTSSEQDNRFSDKEKKLLKQMKFADNLITKIEMNKIKLEAIKPWITKRISELLGMEDEVVVDFVANQLEAEKNPDARKIQINLTGFLNGRNARIFIGELWDMLIAAQESPNGIPPVLIEAKKEEIRKRNEEQERINESVKRTVSRFTEKLKEEKDSSPSRRDRDDRSTSRDRESSKRTKTGDGDDAKDSSKRNYRSRRSASGSPESNNKRKSRSRSGSREKRTTRNKPEVWRPFRPSRDDSTERDRDGGRDRRGPGTRDRPRPRSPLSHNNNRRSRSRSPQRRARSRSRSPPTRSVRRRSPFFEPRNNRNDSNYRDAPPVTSSGDRGRFRNWHDDRMRSSRSPPSNSTKQKDKSSGDAIKDKDNTTQADDKWNKNKADGNKDAKGSESPSTNGGSSSSPETPDGDQSKKKDNNKKDKKKKKDKKHKKHKKHTKKLKKTKDKQKQGSSEDEASNDTDADVDGEKSKKTENGNTVILLPNEKIAQSFRQLVSEGPTTQEDLERKLREKALESMKKANLNR